MAPITHHDRILAHLYKYRYVKLDTEYGAPFEVTQMGISAAVGIARSHASIILKNMEKNRELVVGHSTIKNSNRSVKVRIYIMTEYGKSVFQTRTDDLRREGIDLNEMIHISSGLNYQDIKRIAGDEMDLIGCLCLLGHPMSKDEMVSFPGIVSIKSTGEAYIGDKERNTILSGGSDSDLRRWHSKAADWCIDHGLGMIDVLEHLEASYRDREAVRLIKANRFKVIDCPDRRMLDIIFRICNRRHDPDLLAIAVTMAADWEDLEMAYSLVWKI
jgi:hypothetical protein